MKPLGVPSRYYYVFTVRGNSARVLVRLGDVRVSWRRYAPGFEQPKHAHHGTYLTLVFGGSIRETVASRCEHAGPLSVVIKPEGTEHADRVGPRGAETLQIWMPRSLTQGSLDRKSRPLSWRWLHGGPLARRMLLLLRDLKDCECLDEGGVHDKVYDLVAQVGEQEERTSGKDFLCRRNRCGSLNSSQSARRRRAMPETKVPPPHRRDRISYPSRTRSDSA